MTPFSRLFVIVAGGCAAALLLAPRHVDASDQRGLDDLNPELHAFEAGVESYMALHRELEPVAQMGGHGVLSRLMAGQHLASAIRSVRCDVGQGDIFTPEVTLLFRDLIADALDERDGESFVAELGEVFPRGIHPTINEPYSMTPLYRLPFEVRVGLPTLPPELDYRVAAYDLVLWDMSAGIVVDFVPDAFVTWNVTE